MRDPIKFLVMDGAYNPYTQVTLLKCLTCGHELRDEVIFEVASPSAHALEEHGTYEYAIVQVTQLAKKTYPIVTPKPSMKGHPMTQNKFTTFVKENRKKIIRRTLIGVGIVTTVVVVGALYKSGAFADDALVQTLEDGSVLVTNPAS